MKAVYIEEYGSVDKLKIGKISRPQVSNSQIIIKVKGAGVNPVDWMVREGFLKDTDVHNLPLVLGWDVAGEVIEVGRDVSKFSVGDTVYAYMPIAKQGAYAEFTAVESHLVSVMPRSLDFFSAAGVPLAATTAWQALTQGCHLQPGEKILIHNASGGVGSFAVQMAKALGAYVIGTASSANEEFVKKLGADEFIDYKTQCFEDVVEEVDSVLAAVGGSNVLERSLNVIKSGGYLISLLDEIDDEKARDANIHYQRWWVSPNAGDLERITELIDTGEIIVHIDSIFPLERVKEAHALSESQRAKGKIVLRMD